MVMSALPPKADTCSTLAYVCFGPILLQKSFAILVNSDSVAGRRFAAEAGDDGAAQSRPRAIFLFILS
jgi:hypothetical protein